MAATPESLASGARSRPHPGKGRPDEQSGLARRIEVVAVEHREDVRLGLEEWRDTSIGVDGSRPGVVGGDAEIEIATVMLKARGQQLDAVADVRVRVVGATHHLHQADRSR